MKTHHSKSTRLPHKTLGELVETVSQITRNERLVAMVVADMINTRQVRLEGAYHGKRVVVTQ
jgi:hypothetical protein